MKIILMIATVFCFMSCKQEEKGQDESQQDTERIVIQNQDTQSFPYTADQFKKAFPRSINSLLLDGEVTVEKNQALGDYGKGTIALNIYDCTGKNNGMITLFNSVYANKAQDDAQTKYINQERNGIKTTATYLVNKHKSTMVLLYRNRWYVILKSNNMNPDELWEVFDIHSLENFK